MKKSPLTLVKEKFEDKKKLVEAVTAFATEDLWLGRTNAERTKENAPKGKGLSRVSNAKLLRLHATFTAVKKEFVTRAKLIDAILETEKRTKDAGYKSRLEAYPVPRLYDHYKSAKKRSAAAAKAAKG